MRRWTTEEIELARALLAARAPAAEYMEKLGRPKATCYAKIDRLRFTEDIRKKGIIFCATIPGPRVVAPPEVVEEAQQRAVAPRSLTAWVFGDPPPGYSALDRRAMEMA